MKYIKKFENHIDDIQIGDYVICHEDSDSNRSNELVDFVNNNIGRIVSHGYYSADDYNITFDNIPKKFKKNDYFSIKDGDKEYSRYMQKNEIIDWSKNKEELELKLAVNKYNI